jgi:hypothetical protein
MKLPVDTSAIAFLCAVEAEPVVDFETRRPKADENGEPLYVVQLIALTDGAAEILAVKVPGPALGRDPPGPPGQGVGPGRPALDHAGPLRRGVPCRPDRAGSPPAASEGELTGEEVEPRSP